MFDFMFAFWGVEITWNQDAFFCGGGTHPYVSV